LPAAAQEEITRHRARPRTFLVSHDYDGCRRPLRRSSDLDEVVGIADIVITLYRGRVVARYQGDDIAMASILADITHVTHPIQSVA
jgi:hypothetical protein